VRMVIRVSKDGLRSGRRLPRAVYAPCASPAAFDQHAAKAHLTAIQIGNARASVQRKAAGPPSCS